MKLCALILMMALTLPLLSGCGQPAGRDDLTDLQASRPVPILEAIQGDDAQGVGPGAYLIRSAEQLAALGSPQLQERLQVNFREQAVVIWALGEQPSGGYRVTIDGIQQLGDKLYVQANIRRPASDAVTTAVLTYPFAAAVIPRTRATLVQLEPREVVQP